LDRIDWQSIKDHIDLEAVVESHLGPPAKREGRRLLWLCPFHDDRRRPSFSVDPGRNQYRCWSCGAHGDAVDFVMNLNHVPFPQAVGLVASACGVIAPTASGNSPRSTSRGTSPAVIATKLPIKPPAKASRLPLDAASALVTESISRLWSTEGVKALAYLHHRGLTNETIRAARLGWTRRAAGVPWNPPGVIIPWFEADRLALVKVRLPKKWRERFPKEKRPPKYLDGFRDRPLIYPDPNIIKVGEPLVVAEGEFDAMLLGQELPEASVMTLGSASMARSLDVKEVMQKAPEWFIALDADQAGASGSASQFPAWATRVPLPEGVKDWTELWQSGRNRIRYYWGRYVPLSKSWVVLAAQRWGPALENQGPIVISQPVGQDLYAVQLENQP